MSDDEICGTEIAQQLLLQIDMIEKEEAERIAEQETEAIEYQVEQQINPNKWRVQS